MENKIGLLLTGGLSPVANSTVQPIAVTTDRQEQFNIDDVFTAGNTNGRYVVRVGDIVNDYETGQYWVTAVDAYHIPTLVKWPFADTGDGTKGKIDEFIGRYRTQASHSIYIDTSVHPYRLVVDSSFFIGGDAVTKCKIFLNDDVTEETGICISQWIEDGAKTGDSFPLTLVATDDLTNHSLKVVQPGWTNYKLSEGDIVSAVFYGHDTKGYKVVPLRVFESSVVRDSAVGADVITGISLMSPYIDVTDKDTIVVPMNTTMDSLDIRGVVHYASGKQQILNIDGTKFSLFGADLFMAVQPGLEDDLVLNYTLGPNEQTDIAQMGTSRSISKPYKIVVGSDLQQYSVSLYAVPKWDDTYYRYQMRYFLYTMERNVAIDVTEHIYNGGINAEVFDGNNYSEVQELFVAVNLEDVFPDYPPFKYTKNINVRLYGPYNNIAIPFSIDYDSNHDKVYGKVGVAELHLEAVTPYVYMGTGFRYEWDFLNAMYYPLKPMYDLELEKVAPVPTHFRLKTHAGRSLGVFKVSDWDKSLPVEFEYMEMDTLQIDWIIISDETEMQLATSAIRVTRVGVPSNPMVRVQPESDVYAAVGEMYTLSFEYEGAGDIDIQWRWMNHNGTETGHNEQDNKNRIVKALNAGDEGMRWYAELTNEVGVKVTTNVSTVHVLE